MSIYRVLAPLRSLVSRQQHVARGAQACWSRGYGSGLAEGAEGEEGEFAPELAEVEFEKGSPTFMTKLTFSEKGLQAMIKADIDREKAMAKIIATLGGTLQSYHVTMTGDSNAMIIYTFPKNHDVQTLLFTLMGSGTYTKQHTTKLMTWTDAAMALRAGRNIYTGGGVSCNISLE